MNPVYITQANTITALGSGLDLLYLGLMDQRSGIQPITRFNTQSYTSSYAGVIESLDNKKGSSLIIQLADMMIEQLGGINNDAFLITASTKAGIDRLDERVGRSELLPENLLLSSLTEHIALKTGLKSCGININSACASSTIAIAKGTVLIEAGIVDSVLVCCLDTVSEFVFSGFSSLGAMSDKPARPFDKSRNGLTLGEGAAAIMLMNQKKAKALGKSLLAQITGWGIAGDAIHLTAPAKDGRGLKLAIRKACKKAGIKTDDIHAVNTHGTGTVFNDAMEIGVMCGLFDQNKIIANSIKGSIGHTLGAAGGIETALCVKMIEKGMMPPTKGFRDPEKGAESIISRDARPLRDNRILTTNSGFGGINAAIILEGV
ncbi:MAG: beta-ketoacyl-[acyl-carrier-protein] synthase family protein [Desulfobacula sp.]|nr:beta-ketoacyl-[acyl-carrier-protein] synthase family protein [Desulfobacula sp.]